MWVTYDPNIAFPQPAQFGLGYEIRNPDGSSTHTPPDGLSSFEVPDSELIHGGREDFYTVDTGPILVPNDQASVDAVLLAEEQATQDRITQRTNDRQLLRTTPPQSVPAIHEQVEAIKRYLNLDL